MHWTTIGAMMLSGLAMGLAFDVYRVACHRFSARRWTLPGLDLIYWALATLLVFRVLLDSNAGEVRLYVFLGIGIGITGYFGLFSRPLIRAISFLFRVVQNVLLFLWRAVLIVLVRPVQFVVRLIARVLDIAFIITAALLLWTGRLVLRPFAPLGRWIWRLLLPVRQALRPIGDTWRSIRNKMKQILDILKRKP
jgi:spore cortex biosynthesis protein YabQ